MKTKHTPGPWRVEDNEGSLRILAPDERATIICEGVGPASNESAKADARLIAAAPDLLEALVELLDCISETRGTDATHAVLTAKAAIAKATGEESP